MLKKTILFTLLGFSNAAWCSAYIGVGVGPENAFFNYNSHTTQPGSFNAYDHNQLGGTGWFGTVFAGYGINFPTRPQLYIAAEINANIDTLTHDSSNDEYIHHTFSNIQYRIQNSFGVSILPGFQHRDTTLYYARLGYESAKFKITSSDTSLQNISTHLNGFRCGLGVKQKLSPRWAVRAEYNHIAYGTTNSHTLDTLSNVTKNANVSVGTNQVELGLVFDFC